jgi:hypothetical protein
MNHGQRSILTAAALAALLTASANARAAESTAPGATTEPTLEFAFEENVTLAKGIPVGKTAMGTRFIIPITGGTFEGPKIKGTIMPGGWDWQLVRADGCTHIKADYMIKTDDGVIINVLNQGVICRPKEGAPPPGPAHTVPVFEAPVGKYEWLNQNTYVGTLEAATGGGPLNAIKIRFYQVK